jgi:chemotaxis protein methyltransferase CheR
MNNNLHPQDLLLFVDVLRRESGLVLSPEQEYLLKSRLLPVADRHGVDDLAGVAREIRMGSPQMLRDVVEAMSTHETSFFRDLQPFRQLEEKVLPSLMRDRDDRTLRIWSAGCASGQEAYSIAMLLHDMGIAHEGWKYEILATDISHQVLEKAKAGRYTAFEAQRGVPAPTLLRHFTRLDEQWVVKPHIRDVVKFRQLNLLDGVGHLGQFDLILCRNVLIYFDAATRLSVLSDIRASLRRNSVLMLGAAETPPAEAAGLRLLEGVMGGYMRGDG